MIIFLILFAYTNAACMINYEERGCNDLEMYYQCKNAQDKIDIYANLIITLNNTFELFNQIPYLECDKHVMCHKVEYSPATIQCQNLISYYKCTNANIMLDNFIKIAANYTNIPSNLLKNKPVFICDKKDNILDYYESSSNHLYLPLFMIIITIILFLI